MKRHKLIVKLKGGLGNQMFQYATARAMAERSKMELVIDTYSGFVRDKTYRRSFSLGSFNLSARRAKILEQYPFWFEQFIEKYAVKHKTVVKKRPWGLFVKDSTTEFHSVLLDERFDYDLWLDGSWQCERYFKDYSEVIAKAYRLSPPNDEKFISLGQTAQQHNAIAVGIRLYEEAPPGAHDIAPLFFYEQAAHQLAKNIDSPVFFLFCTVRNPIDGKLNLPGEIHYITHDEGYTGDLNRLWLLSQFRNHIISNSSFYWWGAWLAQQKHQEVKVCACELFLNRDSVPEPWISFKCTH